MPYLWLKVLHVTAVVAFLGNLLTGLFWHAHAARTRDPRTLAHAMDGIIRSDRLFTVPGVIVITATGFMLAIEAHLPLLRTRWICWSLILFSVSGILFMWQVAPLQTRLRSLARDGADSSQFDFAGYAAIARRWEIWGALALLAPSVALILMVLKPV
jgi:uncharacterized membrane protein